MSSLTFNCINHPHQQLEWKFDSVYNRFLVESCAECDDEWRDDLAIAEQEASDAYDDGARDGYDEGYQEGLTQND